MRGFMVTNDRGRGEGGGVARGRYGGEDGGVGKRHVGGGGGRIQGFEEYSRYRNHATKDAIDKDCVFSC